MNVAVEMKDNINMNIAMAILIVNAIPEIKMENPFQTHGIKALDMYFIVAGLGNLQDVF